MLKKIKVGIIYGGRSSEHEISIASAESVMDMFDKRKYQIVPIKISKKGEWVGVENPTNFLNKLNIIFPLIHGITGEDGGLQGFLEFLDIPYVGAGVMDSALGMDKVMQKEIFRYYKLPVVKCFTTHNVEYPCFVKPARCGSSIGISKVSKAKQLIKALNLAKKYDHKVIIEESVERVREFECGVLGNKKPKISVIGEVVSLNSFYDYNAKYVEGKSKIIIPAKISKQLSNKIRNLAKKACQAIDCNGMARVDFLYDLENKKLYINEINTIPGFTPFSMYPKLWEASGLPYTKLLDRLIKLGFEKYKLRKKLLHK